MTCIAAKVCKNRVYFAADSAVSGDSGDISIDVQPKIRKYKNWGWVGECGSCSTLEVATKAFQEENTVEKLAKKLRDLVKDKKDDSSWLIVDPKDNRLTVISSSGEILKRAANFESIGCGSSWALGALAYGASPEASVKIACHYNAYCRAPIIKRSQKL